MLRGLFGNGLKTLLCSIVVGFSLAQPVRAKGQAIDIEASTITVRVSKSGLFSAFADNHVIQAQLAQGTVDDSEVPRVELLVDARGMRVLDPALSSKDRAAIQARMLGPEVLDADRFEHIRFRSTMVEHAGRDHWLVRGNLELHGQVREIVFQVTRESGRYSGSTVLRQTDFGIKPISFAGGTVKVSNEITVEFSIVTADR